MLVIANINFQTNMNVSLYKGNIYLYFFNTDCRQFRQFVCDSFWLKNHWLPRILVKPFNIILQPMYYSYCKSCAFESYTIIHRILLVCCSCWYTNTVSSYCWENMHSVIVVHIYRGLELSDSVGTEWIEGSFKHLLYYVLILIFYSCFELRDMTLSVEFSFCHNS